MATEVTLSLPLEMEGTATKLIELNEDLFKELKGTSYPLLLQPYLFSLINSFLTLNDSPSPIYFFLGLKLLPVSLAASMMVSLCNFFINNLKVLILC